MARSGGGGAPEDGLPIDPSLLDPLSGLYAQPFFLATADLRVNACRRMLRPVAVALFEVVEGLDEGLVRMVEPRLVARITRTTIREADLCARLSDGSYGMLLEDTSEDGAVWAIERLRRALGTRPGGRVVRAGIACYPGHALEAPDIMAGAAAALTVARSWPQDRIEVAAG